MPDVRVAVDTVIGAVSPVLELPTQEVRVALAAVVGAVSAVLVVPPEVRVAVSPVVGYVRVRVNVGGDHWAAAGLPCPRIGYDYMRDTGLIRTQMESGATRQRRRWLNQAGFRSGTIKFTITNDLLYALEVFIDAYGYTWSTISLVTGDSPSAVPSVHTFRVTGDPSFSNLIGDTMDVSLPVEVW